MYVNDAMRNSIWQLTQNVNRRPIFVRKIMDCRSISGATSETGPATMFVSWVWLSLVSSFESIEYTIFITYRPTWYQKLSAWKCWSRCASPIVFSGSFTSNTSNGVIVTILLISVLLFIDVGIFRTWLNFQMATTTVPAQSRTELYSSHQ